MAGILFGVFYLIVYIGVIVYAGIRFPTKRTYSVPPKDAPDRWDAGFGCGG